ncbi:aspartate racemase [Thermoplasmatales archaeon SG8-52-4]|nr:MAG: aspartate racemase [Thermoplasmatales archaeon SG8-52-4]
MKTIGLIGGTTWLSTIEYYRIINETVKEKLGGAHSAHFILYSVDFDEFILSHEGKWDEIAVLYIDIAKKLERSGADFLVICANTLHKIADEIQDIINIPILHIVDVTAEEIIKKGLKKVGLLGTKYTMEENFYKNRLKEKFNIETIIPEAKERKIVHNVIIDELTYEIIKQSSKDKYIKIIKDMISRGAEGIILGCTEIPMLIKENDIDTIIFDTTTIHAKAAVEYALK